MELQEFYTDLNEIPSGLRGNYIPTQGGFVLEHIARLRRKNHELLDEVKRLKRRLAQYRQNEAHITNALNSLQMVVLPTPVDTDRD